MSTDDQPPAEVLLSVVVIVFNDARRLPRAVESVLRQTLTDLEVVIVDDASTDDTPATAARLASRRPGRVRVHRLAENSGGCSRPRNAGLALARGRYVMFLDSDDVLPPDACRALVDAVESADADFSSGRCVRVHVNKGGRLTEWYPWVYAQRAVYTSVLDDPNLLYDTLSTNKCYRRAFLDTNDLRFPDGYHYEDLLFTARAYLAARRIALIPDVVYRWNVVDATDTPSISNRRSELRNFADRIRILRLIDAELAAHGAGELKLHKDVKFLRHDLRLYLGDLAFRDEDYRRGFLALARDYLQTLDARAFDRVEPVQALTAWLILQDDERNLLSAIDYICHDRKLSTRLVEQQGRVYWCADHLDSPDGRAVLDVTDLGFQDLPLSRLDLHNRLVELRVEGATLHLEGEILNQLGRVPRDALLRLDLVVTARRRLGRRRLVPVDEVRHDGDVLRWRASLDLDRVVRAVGFVDRVWDLRGRLAVGGEVNEGRVSVNDPSCSGLAVPVRPALGTLAADRLETLVTPDGDLALEFVPGSALARGVQAAGRWAAASSAAGRVRRAARAATVVARQPGHPRVREEVYRRTLVRLPRRPALVVFESERGARATGNPRAVHDELRRRGVPVEAVWVHSGVTHDFPPDARLVRRGSLGYFAALARAAAWIDDGGVPTEAAKRPGTFYLNTGAGTPVRTVGFDAVVRGHLRDGRPRDLRTQAARWDAVLARAAYDADVLTRAFRLRAPVWRLGYPRNDALLAGTGDAARAALRARLGVEDARSVVLHVPTCAEAVVAPDAAALAPGQVLVVRPGAGAAAMSRPPGADVVDASGVDDMTGLLLLADVLVTDHDAVLFDYPLRGRPVVLVGCRCPVRAGRGSDAQAYLDLEAEAPGPTVWDAAALAAALADLDGLARRHADDIERVAKHYGGYDAGDAAAKVVDRLCRHLGFGGRDCDDDVAPTHDEEPA